MDTRWPLVIAAALSVGLGAAPEQAQAQTADTVAVSVGELRVTISDLERRLAGVPAFQLEALGGTDRGKRRWVQEALVPELLFGQEASAQKLADDPRVKARVQAVLAEALVFDLGQRMAQATPVTDQDVRQEFDRERAHFGTPRRLRIFRILVDTEDRARQLIGEAQGTPGLGKWMEHARAFSLDRATRMRGGDLGFVRADGSTDVPSLRVDPGLFAAAERVKDGELARAPVAEAGHFAVVWRRGSLPEKKPAYDLEAPAIRLRLARQRVARDVDALVTELRKNRVTVVAETLVEGVKVDPFRDFNVREQAGSGSGPVPSSSAPTVGTPSSPIPLK